jgi:hypothetical protein
MPRENPSSGLDKVKDGIAFHAGTMLSKDGALCNQLADGSLRLQALEKTSHRLCENQTATPKSSSLKESTFDVTSARTFFDLRFTIGIYDFFDPKMGWIMPYSGQKKS